MINFKFWKGALCGAFLPLYLGGGGGTTQSQQQTSTTTSLTNQVSNVDSRSVASDHAVALGGNNDSVSSNSNAVTTNNVNVQSTDFGSVQAAINGMQATGSQAIGVTGSLASQALGNLHDQSSQTLDLMGQMFSYAQASSANSQGTAMQALGMANNTANSVQLQASATGKTVKELAFAAVGLAVAFLVFRKA